MTGRGLPIELSRVADLRPIDLDDLVEVADLQRRFDAKYLVDRRQLPTLVAALGSRMRVLEVDGARTTTYHSVYLDTPDLWSYRQHLQRRRRRVKIRTRHYGNPAGAYLEVKSKGPAGRTVKHRLPHPDGAEIRRVGPDALAAIDRILDEVYGWRAPADLAPRAVTTFDRLTLADLVATERVTIDLHLGVEVADRRATLGGRYAVVEVKSPVRRGTAWSVLRELGMRPRSLSKYCLAVAALHEDARGNPWLPTLRQLVASADDAVAEPLGAVVHHG
jgi:hypothetical protein